MNQDLYTVLLWAIFAAAAVTFVLLFYFPAPYGRYMRGGWGVAIKPHWAWLIMESPAVVVIALMALFGRYRNPLPLLFLGIWEIHYVYRTFVYPFLLREAGPRNFPIILIVMAILYNTCNGYVNGYFLFDSGVVYTVAWLTDPRFIAGVVIFLLGFITHINSDEILRSLRGRNGQKYSIPYGGMFRFVSSPNYLGEIIQWCGFALATWSIAGLSFAIFTIANLLPRGVSHHRWYRANFAEYPRERRAVIPFVL